MTPAWPAERLGDALAAAARQVRGAGVALANPAVDVLAAGGRAVALWVERAAREAGLTAVPAAPRAGTLAELLEAGGPVLVRLRDRAEFVLILGAGRGGVARVLDPALVVREVDAAALESDIFGAGEDVRALLDRLPLEGGRRVRAAARLGRSPDAALGPGAAFLLADEARGFVARLRAARGHRLAALGVGLFGVQLLLALSGWTVIGRGALEGRLDAGWLSAWALLLVTTAVAGAAASWAVERLAVLIGGLAKERLLEGILRLEPEEIRTRGVGQLLGTVLEAESLEALARAGGPQAVAALLQILVGAVVLALGAAPVLTLLALGLWLLAGAAAVRAYHRRLAEWAEARLGLTHDLVERLVGHRTALAQGAPPPLASADEYARRAAALDERAAALAGVLPRGWVLLGLAALSPAAVAGAAGAGSLAVGLAGVLLIYWPLRRLADALPGLAAAALAWTRVRPFFAAAAREPAAPAAVPTGTDDAAAGGLLAAREIGYRYPGRPEPALHPLSLELRRGDRLLIDGASGSGKSTLGALLAGLRVPASGALFLGGLDHHSLGPQGWRARAAGVPQFHENHVLSAPLAFNLLMGRGWPPAPEDWREAESLCAELGLGPLLSRMPAGLHQMVGDSGWQLSHGERSRLFVARSLLQRLDLRVLDESFAALDPEALELVLACVLRRTETLAVIAHP